MWRRLVLVWLVAGVCLPTGPADAGMDEVRRKPVGKGGWGELLADFIGYRGFSKSYALVIGISEFENYPSPLPTANDPIRMRDFLIHEAGFDYVHVLTDDKATKERIDELMVDSFPNMLEEDDQFLFYWSGHGEQRPNALTGHVGYLPLTTSRRDRYATMVSMDDIQRWDDLLEVKQALFLLDACFSGLAGSASKSDSRELTIEQLAKPAHHLLTAGTGDEQTIAVDRLGGSIFTDAVLRAIRGEADAGTPRYGPDGVVSFSELFSYVSKRVGIEASAAGWTESITPQRRDLRPSTGEFFFLTNDRKVAKLEGEGAEYQGHFEFGMPVVILGKPDAETCDRDADQQYWETIKSESSPAYFEAYLEQVERGELCGLFAKIARLKSAPPVARLPPPVPAPRAAPDDPASVTLEQAPRLAPEEPATERSSLRDCAVCPEMVVVPAGSFTMGSSFGPDIEKPTREVQVRAGFAIGRFEVTVAEWEACVAGGACERYAPSDAGRGGDREPVVNVSWDDAQAYTAWLSGATGAPYRLPSEAEWEYAARAGSDGKFTSGGVILEKNANFAGANGGPMPVGSYPPNAFGLHDVHGNLWEWVADCIHPYPSFPTTAAPARVQDCQLRGLRGGAWDSDASALRLANRAFRESAVRHPTIGFRVARSLAPGDLQARR